MLVGDELVAVEGMVPAHVAGKARAAHERAHRAEVAGDLAVEDAHALGALEEVGRGDELGNKALHVAAQLGEALEGLERLLLQHVAAHTADEVETVGLAGTREHLRQVHGLLANAEEVLEARVKARVVAHEAQVEQVRVQALGLQADGADDLGAQRHLDALGMLNGLGVGHGVGIAANAADALCQERHLVVGHAALRALLHAAVDEEEAVVGVDDVLALDEQAEVARLVGGDVQGSHGDDGSLLAADLLEELVVLKVGRGLGTIAVVHRVLAQRVKAGGPVVGQHEVAVVDDAVGMQAEHVLHLALRPHSGRNLRAHGHEGLRVARDVDLHHHVAGVRALHGEHVVQAVVAVELALVVAHHDGHPTVALIVQVLDDVGGRVGVDRDAALLGVDPLGVGDRAGEQLLHCLHVRLAAPTLVFLGCQGLPPLLDLGANSLRSAREELGHDGHLVQRVGIGL